jgi:hypothetical protein
MKIINMTELSIWAKTQIESYHQTALNYGTEQDWQSALTVAKGETPNELLRNLTYAMNPGLFRRLFKRPNIVLELARIAEFTRLGGDPSYFTQGAGAGCLLL